MLGVRKYEQSYIDKCRTRVNADVSAFQALAAEGSGEAMEAFEPRFFNNMVLVLDELCVHRLRTVEGKDGNPLNEVRVLAESLMNNGGTMTADKAIKLDPAKSVLGYAPGDEIKVTAADFERLSEAYFAELERKYAN
jgi:hypothetical protein